MPDPIVTKVVDADGVERWGSTDVKWVVDGLADGSLSDPEAPQSAPTGKAPTVETGEEPSDATEVPANGDGSDTRTRKR